MENEKLDFEDLNELHTNELDDIVLEKIEKKDRMKRYLLIGASLALIFIIVIGIVKMVSDSSATPQESLIDTNEIITQSETSPKSDEFQEVPIVSEPETKDEEVQQVINEVINQEKNLAQQEKTEPIQQKTTSKPQPTKPTAATKAKPITKKEAKPANEKKVTKKPAPAPIAKKGSYYIQVGAFLKYAPDKKFLASIKKAGFSYIIKEFNINGKKVRRVYVGPFTSRKEASRYLPKIRAKISKNAFITKVK